MRPDTDDFVRQCIRCVRGLCAALDKWVRHTPRDVMWEEVGQVAIFARAACKAAENNLGVPRSTEASSAPPQDSRERT